MKLISAVLVPVASASVMRGNSCLNTDMQHRVSMQNKLAGICEDMCKEVGAYPQCAQCPGFVAPDSTPGVMTWDELLEHMDNLVEWGQGEIKGWHAQAAKLIQEQHGSVSFNTEKGCLSADLNLRSQVQNKLAGICEDMCKEVGAYPQCAQCPGFVAPDSTPGVMTWDELLEHMDNLVEWGQGEIKGWKGQAAKLLQVEDKSTCNKHDKAMQVLLQSKVEEMGVPCEEMCKRLGVYPDGCQCPGFNGQAPTPGDGRSCVAQWCQDPSSPCPNDGFVECVDASSAVSALQWNQVFAQVDKGVDSLTHMMTMMRSNSAHTLQSFSAVVSEMKAKNPSFSEATCSEMFGTKTRLGGSVPPSDFVVGCTEVCASVKSLKEYWKEGEMATFACGQGASYGCVYDGTPPVQLSGIGC